MKKIVMFLMLFSFINTNAMADQPVISFKFFHKPILTATPGEPLKVSATIDPADKVAYATLLYKSPSDKFYKAIFLKRSFGDTFAGIIPGTDITPPKIMYYITVVDTNGQSHLLFMGPKNPQIVDIGEVNIKSAEETAALEQELALFSAEDVVYSAAKHKQKITVAPASVTVLTKEDIKSVGLSLSDIFRTVPGMDVAYINPGYTIFNERGYGTEENNLMQVLVNGRVLNNTFYGPPFIESLPIPFNDIERIEIIRGASSSLYGADAMTGIISITTKKPQATPTFTIYGIGGLTTEKPAPFFSSFDTYVEAQGATGTTGFMSAIGYKRAPDFETPDHNAALVPKAWLYVTHDFSNDLNASIEAGYDKPQFVLYTLLQNLWTYAEETYIKPHIEYKNLKIDAYWFGFHVNVPLFITPFGTTLNLLGENLSGGTNTYNIDVQYNLPEIPYNRIIVGANSNYNTYKFPELESSYNGIDLTKEFLYGGFIHDEIGPFYNFLLTLDARYDHYSVTPPGLSYRGNLSYAITPEQTIRVSYGTAFRKPIYIEAQFIPKIPPNFIPIKGTLIGNPDLKNEIMKTTEFGYVGEWGKHVRTELTLYYDELYDLIYFYTSLSSASQFQFLNSGTRYVSHGGEINVEYEPIKAIKTFANYSYLQREDNLTGSVANYTTQDFNVGVRYALTDKLFSSIQGDYTSARTAHIADPYTLYTNTVVQLPAYFIVNAKVGYTFIPHRFELGFYVFNMFNDIHHEYPYVYEPNSALTQSTVFGGEEIGRMLLFYTNIYF
ncbi:MAG: TonB-dependent receptor plug domain-containing protein [bacterium]